VASHDPYRELERIERQFLAEELERRIEEFEGVDDRSFGSFTAIDWAMCVVFSVVLPALAIWWAA
jgi:hypothetical protein